MVPAAFNKETLTVGLLLRKGQFSNHGFPLENKNSPHPKNPRRLLKNQNLAHPGTVLKIRKNY